MDDPSSAPAIYTVGYEGAEPARFLKTLLVADIAAIVDIRQRASSRRKGFSKTALRDALGTAGITYRHERELGTPPELRRRLAENQDYDEFFTDYREYLAGHAAALDRLSKEVKGRFALLCFERDSGRCHRRIVASELADRMRRTVEHLTVDR